MLFSSITFLYLFLPCVIILYYLAQGKARNYVLLCASLFFYAWGEPKYVILMILEITSAYLFGLFIEKLIQPDHKITEQKITGKNRTVLAKFVLFISIAINLGLLIYFKYTNFFIHVIGSITGKKITLLSVLLPVGISFYTFQIVSYSIDVYRGQVPAQKNPFLLATYVTMFPQLIAGPIVRYIDVQRQLTERTHSFEKAAKGSRRFIIGLGKKILLANMLGQICDVFFASTDLSIGFYWLNAIAYTLQIYFDFSGYSDMAIGLGLLFGFEFPENFNYPYISGSITEFWRRWHISLGSWFRDYVYFPLGGNRVTEWKKYRNIILVWLLTGFWHGAAWNFILWGGFFAVLLLVEKKFLFEILSRSRVWKHIYVLFLVIISFVIFQSDQLSEVLINLRGMFGLLNVPLVNVEFLYYLKSNAFILIIAIVGATPLPKYLADKLLVLSEKTKFMFFYESIFLFLIFILSSSYIVDGSFNPFLYFRF